MLAAYDLPLKILLVEFRWLVYPSNGRSLSEGKQALSFIYLILMRPEK